jgi:acetyl esterase/lipase
LLALSLLAPAPGAPAADPPAARRLAGSLPGAYPHAAVRAESIGRGPRSYWLFEPSEPAPERPAPVVVFLHGWLAVNPGVYGAWIEHLARSGSVVVYPRYQADWATPPAEFLANATHAVTDALDVLATAPGRTRPDADRFALIGHSAGGNLAALIAASRRPDLPAPRALVVVMPGEVLPLDEPPPSRIPAGTRMLVVVGDRDTVVGDLRARQIFAEATAIPAEDKEYLFYRTDRDGPAPILADHLAPTAGLPAYDSGEGPFRLLQMGRAGLDRLDRAGFWRAADLTLEAGFSGRSLDAVTGQGALLRDLDRPAPAAPPLTPLAGDDLTRMPRVAPPAVRWRPEPPRIAGSALPAETQRR